MKNLVRIVMFMAVASMAFVSCSKDKDDDPRDKFVGSYTSQSSGTIKITISGQQVPNTPVSGTDIFTIEKSGSDASKVLVKSNGNTTECTVSGNNISYSGPFVEDQDGLVLSGTITVNGTINGSTLTFTHAATGTVTGTMSGTFTMNVTEVATKK